MCLGLAMAEPTQAETWYLRNSVDSSNQGVAAPLEYFLRAIAVAGGVCARHNDQSVGAAIASARREAAPGTLGAVARHATRPPSTRAALHSSPGPRQRLFARGAAAHVP